MRWRGFVVVAGIVAALSAAPSARADTFTVTTTQDGNGDCPASRLPCTIRTALAQAAANGVSTLDTISVPANQYVITNGELDVTSNVLIVGSSAANTTLQADVKGFRVLNIGAEHSVLLQHLTITNGVATGSTDGVGGNILVGSGATVLIDHSRITQGKALRGGGIGIQFGTVQLTKSLIDNNQAVSAAGVPSGDGGGIAVLGSATSGAAGTLTLTDSTVFHNSASVAAGIAVRGSATNQATLTRSTIAANTASSTPGAGVYLDSSGNATAFGTIVAGNTGDGVASNCSVKLASNGGNIDSGSTCGFASSVDKQNTDPQLSTLLFSAGGETPVLTLPATSPAIDPVPTASCGTGTLADQRDVRRPQGLGCDAGAYEFDFAPETSIDSGPSGTIGVNTASFRFSSTEPAVTFQCRMDAAAFAGCTSPQSYSSLGDGAHTFQVRAVDATGKTDASPASRPFTVDTTPPDTNITGGPAVPTSSTTAAFTYTSTEAGSTFQCSLDDAAFGTCPISYTGLAQGAHNFRVRATDAVGNTDPTPATRSWTVDTVAPETTFSTGGPSGPTNNNSPSFAFTSTETGSSFECKLDGPGAPTGAFAVCTPPKSFAGLADGAYTLSVRAIDAAGNVDGSPATRVFTVDTTPPALTIDSGPTGLIQVTSATFTFNAHDATA